MLNKPFNKMLKNTDKVEIQVSLGDLSANISIDLCNGIMNLSSQRLTLSYDSYRFANDSSNYINEQLISHIDYHELVRKNLHNACKNLDDFLDKERDIKYNLQSIPKSAIRPMITLTKLSMAPSYWINFQTLRGQLKEYVALAETEIRKYKTIEEVINKGNDISDMFLANSDHLSESDKKILFEWNKVQKDLSYLFSRLTTTAEEIFLVQKRIYDLFFPAKT